MAPEGKGKTSRHPLLGTLVVAGLIGALCSMRMVASGLVFVAIGLIFWLPYSLFLIVRRPALRKIQAQKIGIWFLMIIAVLAVHQTRRVHTRDYADSVVHGIEQFRQREGRYPDSLNEIGFSAEEIRSNLGMARYARKPMFYYPDTALIFHMWRYDFDKREWVDDYD